MTLLKDNDYKEINVALLSLEADIKKLSNNGGFDTSVIDRQLAEINSRIDKINATGNNSSAEINDIRTEIENINTKLRGNSVRIENIEQKLSDIFSAENEATDFNTTTDSGIYYWLSSSANKPGADSGVLLVNKYDSGDGTSNLWINQVAYGTNGKIYFRQNINSGNWTEWKAVAFDGEITANRSKNMYSQTFDLSSLDKTKFYPLVSSGNYKFMEVAILSEGGMSSIEYNQNRIHFDISTLGWSDLPPTLNIREYACYENNEITIGCIGRGVHNGAWAIWLRGGLRYVCYLRDCELSLHTSDYTFGDETYTVGTNYYGGSNTNVSIWFTPQSTIKDGAYSSRQIAATEMKANNRMVIPIGAPSSLVDGCIWIER